MKPPRSKLRGIQQLSNFIQIIWVAGRVISDIHLHFLVPSHISGSSLHFLVFPLCWHSIHQTRIPHPTTSASHPALAWRFPLLSNSWPSVWSSMGYTLVSTGLENAHDPYLSLSRWTLFGIVLLSPDIPLLVFRLPFDQILLFDILLDIRSDTTRLIHCDSFLPACSCSNLTPLFAQQAAGKCPLLIIDNRDTMDASNPQK